MIIIIISRNYYLSMDHRQANPIMFVIIIIIIIIILLLLL